MSPPQRAPNPAIASERRDVDGEQPALQLEPRRDRHMDPPIRAPGRQGRGAPAAERRAGAAPARTPRKLDGGRGARGGRPQRWPQCCSVGRKLLSLSQVGGRQPRSSRAGQPPPPVRVPGSPSPTAAGGTRHGVRCWQAEPQAGESTPRTRAGGQASRLVSVICPSFTVLVS